MPRLSDNAIRERIGSAIAYELHVQGVNVKTTIRCGGSVWIYLHDGRRFKIGVNRDNA